MTVKQIVNNTNYIWNKIITKLIKNNISISTMESCTAGLIATLITNTEGASSIMKGAYVTYSNEAKIQQGVPKKIIDKYGVYSKETSIEMAKACAKSYNANIGIGITGVIDRIDPCNITKDKPVFYTFYINNKRYSYKIDSIPNIYTTRFDRKFYVANVIGKYLDDLIYRIDMIKEN